MGEIEHKELTAKAEAGDAHAQIELAQLLEAEERGNDAVRWLQKAVDAGNDHAKWLLAKRYLTQQPKKPDEGTELLLSAPEGDAEAAHVVAVLCACGIGVPRDWEKAFDYLTRSAELGFPLAREELFFLATGAMEPEQAKEPAPGIWKKLREAIDLSAWMAVPPRNMVSRDPRIAIVEGAASPAMCDWLVKRAGPYRKPASVLDQATGELSQSEVRTNSAAPFNALRMDILFAILRLRISVLTGFSTGMETLNVLHYETGQVYGPHFDFLAPTNNDASRRKPGSQRVLTFLLYLNDDYEGGETHFPTISWKHKGRKGDAMFFWNVDERGNPDRKTLHEGTAPIAGEKWLISQWIRRDMQVPSRQYGM